MGAVGRRHGGHRRAGARSVGFKPGQWAALIAATIALAGLCVWIFSWEDHEEEQEK